MHTERRKGRDRLSCQTFDCGFSGLGQTCGQRRGWGRSWLFDCIERFFDFGGQVVIAGRLRQLQGGFQIGDCLNRPAKLGMGNAPNEVGFGFFGSQADRLIIVGEGSLVLAKVGVNSASIDVGLDIIGPQADRLV